MKQILPSEITVVKGLPPIAVKGDVCAVDTEFFNMEKARLHRATGQFACATFCINGKDVYVVEDTKDLPQALKNINEATWVMHNSMFDVFHLRRYAEVKKRFRLWDSMIADQIMFSGYYNDFSLAAVARRWLGIYLPKAERESFIKETKMTDEMLQYACADVVATWRVYQAQRAAIDDGDLNIWQNIDLPALWTVLAMSGMKLDTKAWIELAEKNEAKVKEISKKYEGINLGSWQQVLKQIHKLGYKKIENTQEDTIKGIADECEFVKDLLEWRGLNTAVTRYGKNWLEGTVEADGRVYSSFHVNGAATGRLSCVSGSTILVTTRGSFRIEEYIPQAGDLVPTHTGEWLPVLRKIFKGYEPMVSVHLSNKNVVQCTHNHRVLTPKGWTRVGDLTIDSEVYSYDTIKEIYEQPRKCEESFASLSRRQEKAINGDNSQGTFNNLSECAMDCESSHREEKISIRKSNPIFKIKNRPKQFYVGQVWFPTSQFYRSNWRWTRIHAKKSGWEICSGTQTSNGKSIGIRVSTGRDTYSSYQWKQERQQTRQPSISDKRWSQETSHEISRVHEITSLGTMGVWDIEVAQNHSYLAQGFINHNSSSPNLENIPVKDTNEFRDCFVAGEGNVLIDADWSAQEPRIAAYLSGDEKLMEIFKGKKDIYIAAAKLMFDWDLTKKDPRRKTRMKPVVLGASYGLTEHGMERKYGIPLDEGKELLRRFFDTFEGMREWKHKQQKIHTYVTTIYGRKFWLNPYMQGSENNALNSPVQGSAADAMKIAAYRFLNEWGWRDTESILVNVVHDEIILEVPENLKDAAMQMLKKVMIQVAEEMHEGINADVEVHASKSWGAAKE